jgi:molybdopterin-containing oxidoreductase family iron-sulfur binding subunit
MARHAAAQPGRVSRRDFLRLAGASLALAGLGAACSPPRETIVPYARRPEEVIPGEPLYFATAMPLGGYATGLLVESHEGRPIKVEGNPEHPDSLGATDVFAQAAVLDLYDPARDQGLRRRGRVRPWDEFERELRQALDAQRESGGAGLRLLTETITSPSLAGQIARLLEDFPQARWHQYEPVNRDNARAGALLAFGEDVAAQLRVGRADVILALEADLLACGPGHLRHAREFAARRRAGAEAGGMNRLYAAESSLAPTGARADHRLPLRSTEIEGLARALAIELGLPAAPPAVPLPAPAAEWAGAVARDLAAHRGASLIVAGEGQPPAVHALAHALNDTLGNAGNTVVYTAPAAADPVDQSASLRELAEAMQAGQVQTLIVLEANPIYSAPAGLGLAGLFAQVEFTARLGLYADETSAACEWHVPAAHFLESWGDARASDGTASLIQPLIAPLYGGLPANEFVALLAGRPASGHDIVRAYWQGQSTGDFEDFWRSALHAGIVPGTALPEVTPALQTDWLGQPPAAPGPAGSLEIVFRPDPSTHDGRFFGNAWLRELPKPITKLTWENAALIGPATAERLGLGDGDVVSLRLGGNSVRAPILVVPGHAPDSVTAHLGYGRPAAGDSAQPGGFNAYALWPGGAAVASGLELSPTGDRYPLALTQEHHRLEGRDIVRFGTLAEYQADPHFAQGHDALETLSLYPEYEYTGYRWGMAIDIGACTGCNACVIACQAENNIPVVGKDQVLAGREMHWLRVDQYFVGEGANPQSYFQPVPCMHCEKAPCEVVCPVAATVHSDDGLNDMVYNRCVGTRYCSNNCPYKVRRFNYLDYHDNLPAAASLRHNPDVTVRTRGVIEKCTYCVQRIRESQGRAERDGRRLDADEVMTACQQACPTQAIVFGDLNDPESAVAGLKAHPLNYAMLGELNTQPRTTYLAALRNPNPELDRG